MHRIGRPGRQGGLPLQPVRDGRRPARLRLLRPARPQERLHLARHRPVALEGRLQRRRSSGSSRATSRAARWSTSPQSARMSTYVTALCAGPYHEVRDHHDGIDLGLYVRSTHEAVPRRRRPVHRHQAGLRLLPRAVRRALPAAQVRPALGAGLQRRRDGELRLRHARRGALHLPLAGHRLRVRAAGQHDPARDGPHVVRRPRHHALVGRPVAQRVVRRVGLALVQHPRDPLHRRLDHVPVDPQELGLPPGPALLHPPGLLRDARRRGGRGQLRRHHVRQGRLASSSSSSRTSASTRSSTGLRAYFAAHAWGNATFDDLLSALEEASGRPAARLRRRVAGDRSGQHAAARSSRSARTAPTGR